MDSPLENESTKGLLGRLFGDLTALFRNEFALARAELASSATRAKAGLVSLLGAVSTLLAGSLALVAAAILALAQVMEPWLASLVVGVVITAVTVRRAASMASGAANVDRRCMVNPLLRFAPAVSFPRARNEIHRLIKSRIGVRLQAATAANFVEGPQSRSRIEFVVGPAFGRISR